MTPSLKLYIRLQNKNALKSQFDIETKIFKSKGMVNNHEE